MYVSFSLKKTEEGNFMRLVDMDDNVLVSRKLSEPKRLSGSRISYGNIPRIRAELARIAKNKNWTIL